MRVSDADREQVAAVLRDHYSAGRLSDDELEARLDSAIAATTKRDLDALTLDLPAAGLALPAAPAPRRQLTRGGRALRASFRMHLAVYLIVNAGLIAIWAAGGGGSFWPIWPMIGWGIGLGGHFAPIAAGVGTGSPAPRHRSIAAPAEPHEIAAAAESVALDSAAGPDGTVTILFSDIAGSTALNERLGDLRWLEVLREHHSIVREQVRAHGGFEVKAQGDGFMIAFPSARKAVLCALAIQHTIEDRLGDHPDGPVRLRIGLHTGEAIREGDDLYGRNVVMAARVAEQAGEGEILASAVVKQLTESAGDLRFADGRDVELKGLGPQALYRVAP